MSIPAAPPGPNHLHSGRRRRRGPQRGGECRKRGVGLSRMAGGAAAEEQAAEEDAEGDPAGEVEEGVGELEGEGEVGFGR